MSAPSCSSSRKVAAATTSVNDAGEIVCTVEETNRIRLALGMKPLRLSPSRAKKEKEEERKAQPPPDALRERIEKMKKKRRAKGAQTLNPWETLCQRMRKCPALRHG